MAEMKVNESTTGLSQSRSGFATSRVGDASHAESFMNILFKPNQSQSRSKSPLMNNTGVSPRLDDESLAANSHLMPVE